MEQEQATIDQLIISGPYDEPQEHWRYDRDGHSRGFSRRAGRRPAGYLRASGNSRAFDDPGVFVEIPLVNQIRQRVKGLARCRVSRRHRRHQAPAGLLDRPGGI